MHKNVTVPQKLIETFKVKRFSSDLSCSASNQLAAKENVSYSITKVVFIIFRKRSYLVSFKKTELELNDLYNKSDINKHMKLFTCNLKITCGSRFIEGKSYILMTTIH